MASPKHKLPTLLALPAEITNLIFLQSLIPDTLYITCVSKPLEERNAKARLLYRRSVDGDLEAFSLNWTVVSRSFRALFLNLLSHCTTFNLGRACDAQFLLQSLLAEVRSLQPVHISIHVDHAGSLRCPLAGFEDLHCFLRQLPSLQCLSINLDLHVFGKPGTILQDRGLGGSRSLMPNTFRTPSPMLDEIIRPEDFADLDVRSCLHHRTRLFELLVIYYALVVSIPVPNSRSTDSTFPFSSKEIRIPFFQRDLPDFLKPTLLQRRSRTNTNITADPKSAPLVQSHPLSHAATIEWIPTGTRLYAGTEGYISVHVNSSSPPSASASPSSSSSSSSQQTTPTPPISNIASLSKLIDDYATEICSCLRDQASPRCRRDVPQWKRARFQHWRRGADLVERLS